MLSLGQFKRFKKPKNIQYEMVNDSTFDLSLSFQKRLKEKIVGREKIRLSDGNQPFWNKLFTVSLWISFALFFAIGYFFLGLSWMLLFSSVAAAVFYWDCGCTVEKWLK